MNKKDLIKRTKGFAQRCIKLAVSLPKSGGWLEFIIDEQLKPEHLVQSLKNEAHELTSIFISSRKTIQTNKKIINRQS
jgi:hypothetical protein